MADSLESILKDLREQLLTTVDARPIADDACDKEIIPEELKTSINQAKSVREANMILYQHLLQQGTQSKLKELCTIMINAKGYGRMIEFGQVLQTKITAPVEQRIEVCQQNGSDGIEVVDNHMLWQIKRIAKERTWDPVRKLYIWICTRVAESLQGRLPNIKVSIDNQHSLKCSPYDKLTQQDLEKIRSCDLVDEIMQIVGISKQWLDVSYLEHFIRDMADPPTVDRTELWLNRYKQLLQCLCCKVLLREAPGDHEVLQGLLKGVEAKIQSSCVLIVIYDIDYKCFNVAQLLEEKECLEKLLGIRPGCLNCLRVEPAHSVAIYWLIDKCHMLDGRRIFWPLLLRRVTSLELVGSPTLSLKGGHVPYLIRDALLAGLNLIQQTEVFSRQFLALVGPTDHPLENSNNAEVQHRRLLMRLLKAPPSHRFFLQESHDKDVPQTLKVEQESEGRMQYQSAYAGERHMPIAFPSELAEGESDPHKEPEPATVKGSSQVSIASASDVEMEGSIEQQHMLSRARRKRPPEDHADHEWKRQKDSDTADLPQGDVAILSEMVSDHPRYLMLFRRHISRRAAGKGRAVLEGVGLDASTIVECFANNPLNEEGAVQQGLSKWCEGEGFQPPTWGVLIDAIEFAQLAQQDIEALRRSLRDVPQTLKVEQESEGRMQLQSAYAGERHMPIAFPSEPAEGESDPHKEPEPATVKGEHEQRQTTQHSSEIELSQQHHRSSSTSLDDLVLQQPGAKKSLPDYMATKMDLLAQDMSDLHSEPDPEVIIKLLYGNALATISDLLEPHLKEVKKGAVTYHHLGVHHVAVGKDIIESADSIDTLMYRMSVNSMWNNTRFLRRAIACIPQSSSDREVAEGILFHYNQYLAIYERATLLRDAQTKESESKEEVEASTEANKLVPLEITSSKAFDSFSCEDCYILQVQALEKAYGIPEEKIICRDVKEYQTFEEELVSGTADNEEVETTSEMEEDYFPPKVEEEAELDDDGKIMEATDSGAVVTSLSDQPTLRDVVCFAVPRVAPKWYDLGLALDIKPFVLDDVANQQEKADRPREMFVKWLEGSPGTGSQSRTWQTVLDAVGMICGPAAVEDIRTAVQKPRVPTAGDLEESKITERSSAIELPRKRRRSSCTSSDDLDLQQSVAKKSLPDYMTIKMDLLAQDMSYLRSESDPEVIIKLLYGNALTTISDLLKPHLKAVKKAAGRYQCLGLHHVSVGEDIIESADSIDSLMSRMSVGGMWDSTRFLRKAIASIPHSAPERGVTEAILFHYDQHMAIFKRATLLKDALPKGSESKEEVEASMETNKPFPVKITSSKAFDSFSCEDCYILQVRGLKKAYGIPEGKIICRDVEEFH